MKITMIGTGYVGLVSGACFAELGHDVRCVDRDPAKIATLKRGESPIYEPGLVDLVRRGAAAGRLHFTTDTAAAVDGAEAIFIAVGTPPSPEDGQADLSYVFAAAADVARALTGHAVIVTKSTVPVGTNRRVAEVAAEAAPHARFDVASNPEFLREGAAVRDFLEPDRIVIGAESPAAQAIMERVYAPLTASGRPLLVTSLETAEIVKYAANALLATKIAFINEIADLCEAAGADIGAVSRGVGLDPRIGARFLNAGPGYGGSCFPKDTQALAHTARAMGTPATIVEATIAANAARKRAMADKIIAAMGGSVAGKTLAVLGVAFKGGTDDMRDSPALDIIPALQGAGATIRAFDPAAMDNAAAMLPNVVWAQNVREAAQGADAAIIVTEWADFAALDLPALRAMLAAPLLIDLRNLYAPGAVAGAGLDYISIGRPPVGAAKEPS